MRTHPTTRGSRSPFASELLLGLLMTGAGCLWLTWLDRVGHLQPAPGEAATARLLPRVLGQLGVVLPVVMLATSAGLYLARRAGGRPGAGRVTLACAPLAAAALAIGRHVGQATGAHTGARVLAGAVADDLARSLVVLVPLAWAVTAAHRPGQRTRRLLRARARAAVVLGAGTALIVAAGAGIPAGAVAAAPAASTSLDGSTCLQDGAPDRSFAVTALDVDITINRFGDHDPKGKMFALNSALPAVAAQVASHKVSTGLHEDAVQPLVIRANEGDCVEITFTNNATGGDYGIHIDGLEFTTSSSGDSLGANPSSAVPIGGSATYRFHIPMDPALEGAHYLHPGPGYRAAVNHGLFGALVVEPPGSTYWSATNPGQQLASGWEAIVKPMGVDAPCGAWDAPATCAFREAALLHHEIGNDNELLKDKKNLNIPLVDNTTGSYRPGAFALNYRSEPFRNRLLSFPKEKAHSYSSFTFGEPATPMARGYLADPTKIRLMHVGAEKFHVFHLHGGGDRWRFNPLADAGESYADTGLHKDPATPVSASERLDSQSIGPGESYNLDIEGGAGGVQQSAGDFLFHCHIAKHYTSGMWGLWRVFDTRQPDLVPLTDRELPPLAVESSGLIGRTVGGTTITADTLDDWIRPQLPPPGIPRNAQDATVWNWNVVPGANGPRYLGAPADRTVFPDSVSVVAGQPNLLPVDVGHLVGDRPAILFNPVNGRPAYPMLRTAIGRRPPFTGSGHTGTPWLGDEADRSDSSGSGDARASTWNGRSDGLCPKGRTLRTFNVVSIGKPIPRTPSFTDPAGKLFVLAHDKAATYADPAKSDPLAIRANKGDCIELTLTNEIPDSSAFDNFSKTSMHIHHVQFDVQGSDGVSAGFAYEHSVRPYTAVDPKLLDPAAKGSTVLHLSAVTGLVGLDAAGRPTHPYIAVGEGLESIEVHQVRSVDAATGLVTLTEGLESDHASGESAGTEFVRYRWYPDALLDNVFWHDHVDGIHGWGHGLVGQLIVEPSGSTYHDPNTGQEVDSGTLVDVHTSNALAPGLVEGSFRELALWTINDNDAGAYSTLNLKANPLSGRLDKPNQFSSWTYGDPVTPLPRLYPDDPLVVRTINVSPTVDSLHIQGGRTVLEPRYTRTDGSGAPVPEGTVIDAVHYGVSEKYSLVLNGTASGMRMRPGDYLYGNGNELRTQQGAWGLVRVLPGKVDTLRPLPGVRGPSQDYTQPLPTGGSPPAAASPGNPCPAGAPTRRFDISALDKSGIYNGGRTAYVPDGDVASIKKGLTRPVPLVLHVTAGECVTVHLTNLLTTPVGFSVGKLDREAGSGGANVGFSPQQNVAPAAARDYVYLVPTDRLGSAVIADLASSSRMKQGLYGVVVVAPASQIPGQVTEFSDPVTGAARDIGAQVLVHVPGAPTPDYRDFTVTVADDDATIGQDFMPYPTSARVGRSLVNYQAAPAGDGSAAFRHPGAVPWLTAFAGDPELVHVLVTPGSENTHAISLGGLRWQQDRFVGNSESRTVQGMAPWETADLEVVGGAGGTAASTGDFFYGDLRRPFTAVGLWGLQRVLPPGSTSCPVLLVDGSTC